MILEGGGLQLSKIGGGQRKLMGGPTFKEAVPPPGGGAFQH